MSVQGIHVSDMSSVEMLFKFIAPLVEEGEDDDDMDEEVSRGGGGHPGAGGPTASQGGQFTGSSLETGILDVQHFVTRKCYRRSSRGHHSLLFVVEVLTARSGHMLLLKWHRSCGLVASAYGQELLCRCQCHTHATAAA